MKALLITLTVVLIAAVGFCSPVAKAQMPGQMPGQVALWAVSAHGCPSGLAAALSSQWSTASASAAAANSTEAGIETQANSQFTTELAVIVANAPTMAYTVTIRRLLPTATNHYQSFVQYQVDPDVNFTGCKA